jgi:hypothetical protein
MLIPSGTLRPDAMKEPPVAGEEQTMPVCADDEGTTFAIPKRTRTRLFVAMCVAGALAAGCTSSPGASPTVTTAAAPSSTAAATSTSTQRANPRRTTTSTEPDAPATTDDPPTTDTPPTTNAPADGGLVVPFGLYAASSYNGSRNVSIASMRLRPDGTYSMMANPSGSGIVDPDDGEEGEYESTGASSLRFTSGAYEGLSATLVANYQGSGRDFVDVQLADGTKQSYSFVNA